MGAKKLTEKHNGTFHAECPSLLSLPIQNLPVSLCHLRFTEKWVSKDYRRLRNDRTVKMADCKTMQKIEDENRFSFNIAKGVCVGVCMWSKYVINDWIKGVWMAGLWLLNNQQQMQPEKKQNNIMIQWLKKMWCKAMQWTIISPSEARGTASYL